MTRTRMLSATVVLAAVILLPGTAWAQQSDTSTVGMSPSPSPSPTGPDYCAGFYDRRMPSSATVDKPLITAGDTVTYTLTLHGPFNRLSGGFGGYEWYTTKDRNTLYPGGSGFFFGHTPPGESHTVSRTYTLTGNARLSWSGASYCGPGPMHGDIFGANPVVVNVAPRLTLTAVRNGVRDYTFSGVASRPGQLISLYRVTADGSEVLTKQAYSGEGRWQMRRKFLGSGRFGFVARTSRDMANAPGASNVRPTVIH